MKNKLSFSKGLVLLTTALFLVGGFFVATGTAFAATATVASQIEQYTSTGNDGLNFVRLQTADTRGTVSQTTNPNGSVVLNINNAAGYADSGFYTNPRKLGDLKSVTVNGSGAPYIVNVWLDTDANGEFFTWNPNGNVFTGANGDGFFSEGSSVPDGEGILTINDSSSFHSYSGDYNPSFTLGELKTLYSDKNIAFWVGTTVMPNDINRSKSSTITAFDVVLLPVVNTRTLNRYATIQAAVDAADSSDTINVAAGIYDEQVIINKAISLVSVSESGKPVIGQGIKVASSNVTVNGFKIIPASILGEVAGVYLQGNLDTVIIKNNEVNGTEVSGTTRGMELATGNSFTNISIENNVIHDVTSGIYTNTHTGVVKITANEIYNTAAGIGGLMGAEVKNNNFHYNSETIGADSSITGSTYLIEHNTILNKVNAYEGIAVNAEKNWWGSPSPSSDTIISGNVSYSPWYIDAEMTTLSNLITVTFDKNGGTVDASPTSLTTNYNTTVTLPTAPTKTGYTFDSWKTATDGSGTTFDASTAVMANVTVYAKWTINTHTITFDSAGGSVVAPIVQNYGTAVAAPTAPTKAGYTFSAWSPAFPATMGLSQTLTAQWTANQGGGNGGGRNLNATTPAVPAKVEIPDGCAAGNKFSTTTGRNCNAATPAVPAGQVLGASTQAGQVLGAESFHFTLALKNNSKGNEVIELQKFLTALGYTLTADGKFGAKTKGAVIKFQIANGLKGDGIVGALTRVILNK